MDNSSTIWNPVICKLLLKKKFFSTYLKMPNPNEINIEKTEPAQEIATEEIERLKILIEKLEDLEFTR